MSDNNNARDPLEFISNMWNNMGFSLPGIVTPTLDIDELDKRIHDLKTVEHWLKVNLNMLQMTTQSLEMQRATLAAVKAMSETAAARQGENDPRTQQADNPFAAAATLWPWSMMPPQSSSSDETSPQNKNERQKNKATEPPQTTARSTTKVSPKKD